jgi:hypothetical protein
MRKPAKRPQVMIKSRGCLWQFTTGLDPDGRVIEFHQVLETVDK